MSIGYRHDLESFHRFLGERLAGPDPALSPEECLAEWRAQHPSQDALASDVLAVREALEDMAAGDTGEPASRFLDRLRREHGLNA